MRACASRVFQCRRSQKPGATTRSSRSAALRGAPDATAARAACTRTRKSCETTARSSGALSSFAFASSASRRRISSARPGCCTSNWANPAQRSAALRMASTGMWRTTAATAIPTRGRKFCTVSSVTGTGEKLTAHAQESRQRENGAEAQQKTAATCTRRAGAGPRHRRAA